VAAWADWWPMAAQTLWQRGLTIAIFASILALVVQLVRKAMDRKAHFAA